MGYVPHTEQDRAEMLATIGADSIETLFQDIPSEFQLDRPLNIPHSLDEYGLYRYLGSLAALNEDSGKLTCFLGAGSYDHYIPASVGTALSRGEFLTSYTPYQPELSQGYLQTIYEFQSMICAIYGMDVANASMYDAATALAEAAFLAHAATDRKKVVASKGIHPHYRQVVRTMCWAGGLDYVEVGPDEAPSLDGAACFLFQYPDFFGIIRDARAWTKAAHDAGALAISCSDPIAMGALKPPGEYGVDIVVGEGQPLGSPMGFGGPCLGLFTVKEKFVRRIPGRVVGITKDMDGKRGFVMTLRTREQDIRREKATSNICTNQALIALAATVYMTAVGKTGLRQVSEGCIRNAHYLADRLTHIPGLRLKYPDEKFAFEFVLELPKPAAAIRDVLMQKGILAGLPLDEHYSGMDNCLLVCATEVRTKEEMDRYAEALREVSA